MNYTKFISGIALAMIILVFSNCTESTVLEEEFDINQKESTSNASRFKEPYINNQKELAQFILEDDELQQLDEAVATEIVYNSHFDKAGIMNFNLEALRNYDLKKEYTLAQKIIDGLKVDFDYGDLRINGRVCGPVDACVPAESAWCGNCPGGIDYGGINLGDLIRTHWEYTIENLNKDFVFGYEEHMQLPEPQTNKWYFEHFSEAAYKLGKEEGDWINEHVNSGEIKVFASKVMSGKNEAYVTQLIFPKNLKRIDSLIESNGLIVNNLNFFWGRWMFCNCRFQFITSFSNINCNRIPFDECFRVIDPIPELINPFEYEKLILEITKFNDLDQKILEKIIQSPINEALNTPEILQF